MLPDPLKQTEKKTLSTLNVQGLEDKSKAERCVKLLQNPKCIFFSSRVLSVLIFFLVFLSQSVQLLNCVNLNNSKALNVVLHMIIEQILLLKGEN